MKRLPSLILLLIVSITPLPLAGQDAEPALPALPSLPTLPVDGYWLDSAPLNEVFEYLAREARMQYWHMLKTF